WLVRPGIHEFKKFRHRRFLAPLETTRKMDRVFRLRWQRFFTCDSTHGWSKGHFARATKVFWSFALFLTLFLFSLAGAQAPPAHPPRLPEPTGRSGEPPTLPQELNPPTPPAGTLLPPAPLAPKGEPFPALRVFVREIKITGSTVFSAEQLNN